mmetsp:Transcript_34162/g.82810  ORF Transcript_34162/g.82810 Transcript_34162/m.82810 type:complete len:223 (+) Transcript_34162:1129-1797(+)
MSVSTVNVSNGSSIVTDALSHTARSFAWQSVVLPIDDTINKFNRPVFRAGLVEVGGDTFGRRRSQDTTGNVDGVVSSQAQSRVDCHDIFMSPGGDLTVEDSGQKAWVQLQLGASSGDRVEETNGSHKNGQVKDGSWVELVKVFRREGDISRSKVIEGAQASITHEILLTSGRTNTTVCHADGKLGLLHEGVHDVPVALLGVSGTGSMEGGDCLSNRCWDSSG